MSVGGALFWVAWGCGHVVDSCRHGWHRLAPAGVSAQRQQLSGCGKAGNFCPPPRQLSLSDLQTELTNQDQESSCFWKIRRPNKCWLLEAHDIAEMLCCLHILLKDPSEKHHDRVRDRIRVSAGLNPRTGRVISHFGP